MTFILGRYCLSKLLIFSLIITAHTVTYAQEFDEQQIKSAYIVNFFNHITWPNEENKKVFRLTIYKDRNYVNFLSNALKNKKIKDKSIVVIYANNLEALKQGDSAYIPQKFNENIHEISNALRNTKTLLITDNSENKHDVMINLFQQKNSTVISFAVNKSNIIYEKLTMSDDLLLLGGSEYDIATLYRETELAMRKTKLLGLGLQHDLLQMKTQLATSVKQLDNAKYTLDKLNSELTENAKVAEIQKTQLAQLKVNVAEKQLHLDEQKQKLAAVSEQSKEAQNALIKQQELFEQESKNNRGIIATVEQNKSVLRQQEKELAKHKIQLKEQGVELTDKTTTISNQQTYLFMTTILTTLAILSALLIIFFFRKNQKTTKELSHTLAHLNDTQEQLVQSEKMASLGRLVAGVAHEINTPLSIAITANSLVLDDTLDIKSMITAGALSKSRMDKHIAKAEESLVMSENALERVKKLLVNFKLVSADQVVSEQREIQLVKYIDEVMSTLSVEMKKRNIHYQLNSTEETLISTIPGVFSQVLSNLVMNSLIHGFDDKQAGDITITLQQHVGNTVKIIYHDNGKGMDEHTLENIFEPFFTTKRGMGSTGLGMNIVFNLVNQQLKGTISVNTEQGIGTSTTLILPHAL